MEFEFSKGVFVGKFSPYWYWYSPVRSSSVIVFSGFIHQK